MSTLFELANTIAMIGWVVLVIGAIWSPIRKLATWTIIPILLAMCYGYVVFLAPGGEPFSPSDFGSLEGVMKLFRSEKAVLAGWIHYLAFDLWVGSWEVSDAKKHGVPLIAVLPCLFFTLMLGPVGFLLYIVVRGIKTKMLNHENISL